MRRLIKLWKADIKNQYKMDPDLFVRQFMKKTDYISAMRKWTPDVLDEIRGMASAAECDFDSVFVSQFFDEYYAQGKFISASRCSSLGISRQNGEPAYIAQNNDLETFRDGFQVVLRIKVDGSDLEILVHSNPGCIGWNGVNNKGIGVCINTVAQLGNCRDGLPVNCVIRGLLMQKNEQDAIAFLRRVKHASGANYLIGGPNRVYSFECSTNKIAQYRPNRQDDVVWHTNHSLVNDDYNVEYRTLTAR
jgi:isopenicillin-N N-acyltransferase like protein